MRGRGWRLGACGVALAGMAVAGCSLITGKPEASPAVATTAPATGPARPAGQPANRRAISRHGYDPAKALLPLESIPPVEALPAPKEKADRAIPSQAVKHYLAGRDLFGQWRNAEAITALGRALRYDPGSFECHRLLGRAALRGGNVGLARNHLREAAKLHPDDVTCQYLLGRLAIDGKDPSEALRRLRLALTCSNADPARAVTLLTRFRLGEVLLSQGYLTAAIEQLEAFEEGIANPRGRFWRNRELLTLARSQRPLPSLMIGQAALTLGRYDRASEAFGRALKLDPKNLRTKVRYAQALARAGHRDRALELAQDLALRERQMKAGVELLGWIYKDAGHPERLTEALRKLLAAHPDRGDLGVMLADALIRFGRKDQAEQALRRLIKDNPKLVEAYARLASLLREEGRVPDAVRILADAIAAGPKTHAGVLRAVAQLGSNTETARKVISQADEILAADANNHALRYVVGLLALHADRQELAIRCFNRTIELNEDFVPSYLSLGRLYLERFEWQRAIEVARRAEKAGQKTPAIAYLLARGHDGLDENEQAAAAYQQAIKQDPKSVAAMVALGRLYERMGQRNKAQRQYQRVLKIAPANNVAGERLIRLLLARGDADEAQKALRRFRRAKGGRNVLGRCLAAMASRGDMKRYRHLLGKLLAQAPKDVRTRYDLATSFYATREYDRAGKEVERILKLAPGHQKARFLMAELCRKRLDYDSASKLLAGLLREHPNRPAWLLAQAEVYIDAQDYDHAAALIDRLARRAKRRARRGAYRLRLIGVHVAARRYDKAASIAQEWLKDDPTSWTARRLLVEALHEDGKDDRAIGLAREWLTASAGKTDKDKLDGPRREARRLLISAYSAAKRHEQALETLLGWMEDDPSNRSLWRQLWLILFDAKRHEDAAELCDAAIAMADQPHSYRVMLAQSYLEADRYDDALAALKQIPKSKRDELVTRLEIMILVEAKRYDRALQVVKQAAAHAESDESRLAMARLSVLIRQRQGRMDLVEKEMAAMYAKQPKDPGVNNDLGYTWADAGRNLDQAERMTRYALGEEPRNAAYMDSLGWVLYKKGDLASAVHYLRKASRAQGGDDPVIFDHLGDAYWRSGKKDEARKSWQQAVDLSLKEQSEGKEPADPKTLPQARRKLAQLERGDPPSVADVVAAGPSTTPAGRAEVKPSSAPAGR